ncbi:MAG TPA: rod shape-determining protein MreC [Planctomycetota bacterium]
MTGRRRRFSLFPWIGLSLALLLLPFGLSQKVRLFASGVFRPFKAMVPGTKQELEIQKNYYQDQVQRLHNELALTQQKLEAATGVKQTLKDMNPKLLTADVLLPTDGSPWRKSMTIALGAGSGVRKGMLVLYNSQLVGRVLEAGPLTSRVQLCVDPGFRVGAVAVPRQYTQGVSFEKRHVGVYEGTSGDNGQLKWLSGDTPVETDALVLTTEDPLNGIPRGLILGRVSKLSSGRGAFPRVEVEPIVNFRGLEQVMLLVPTPEAP